MNKGSFSRKSVFFLCGQSRDEEDEGRRMLDMDPTGWRKTKQEVYECNEGGLAAGGCGRRAVERGKWRWALGPSLQ